MLLDIIIATTVGSFLALIGGILLLWRESIARKLSLTLLSFAVGTLLGAAFLELIPEALHEGGEFEKLAPFIIGGIFIFFLFERILSWYHGYGHAHNEDDHDHSMDKAAASSVILGDTLHNFIDGIIIALSFAVSREVGIATTVAVFLHEIPQEIGDFGVLLHLGYKRSKIILVNLLSAAATVVGALLGYLLSASIEGYIPYFMAFTAGSFIYIAISDLLPELKHKNRGGDIIHILALIGGAVMIHVLGVWFHE